MAVTVPTMRVFNTRKPEDEREEGRGGISLSGSLLGSMGRTAAAVACYMHEDHASTRRNREFSWASERRKSCRAANLADVGNERKAEGSDGVGHQIRECRS